MIPSKTNSHLLFHRQVYPLTSATQPSFFAFTRHKGFYVGMGLLASITILVGTLAASVGYYLLREPPHEAITYNLTDEKVSFVSLGDQGTGNFRQWQVAQGIKDLAEKKDLDFVMLLGDNFYRYGIESVEDPQWLYKFENMYRSDKLNQTPFYAVLGNHDYGGNEQAEIEYSHERAGSGRWHMPARDYIQYYGAADDQALLKVVYLDTSPDSREHKYTAEVLTRLLEKSDPAIWTVVASHVPIRTGGSHYFDGELVNVITPILSRFKVAAYFSGHDHNQQLIKRPSESLYIVSGTGGKHGIPTDTDFEPGLVFNDAQLGFTYTSVTPDNLVLAFYNSANEKLYETTILAQDPSKPPLVVAGTK